MNEGIDEGGWESGWAVITQDGCRPERWCFTAGHSDRRELGLSLATDGDRGRERVGKLSRSLGPQQVTTIPLERTTDHSAALKVASVLCPLPLGGQPLVL